MSKKNIFIFAVLIILSIIGIYSVRAGTLEFDGVPVDITTTISEDLVIVPGEGGNTQIGDASGTNSNATSNDDLHVTGVIESDGAIYADSGITVSSNIISDTDSADSLGSSSIAWSKLYVDTILTTSATDLGLSPASGSGVDYTITRSAETGNEAAVDIAATINKATSGNYTGIKLNVTETSAPGTADKLLDLQVGSTPYFQIFNSAASANYGLLSVGSDDWDGSTDGYFDGNANGTLIAGNAAADYEGNLIDLQIGGTSLFNVDSDGNVTAAGTLAGSGILGGSGTAGYLSKWSAGTTLDDSVIYDDGTNVGIGTASPGAKLELQKPAASDGFIISNSGSADYANEYFRISPVSDAENLMYVGTYFGIANGLITLGSTINTGYTLNGFQSKTRASAANNDAYIPLSLWGSDAARTAPYFAITSSDLTGTAFPDIFVIDASGQVGIGATSPGAKLQIGNTPNFSNTRNLKIYDDGVDGAARVSLIGTSGQTATPAVEFVIDGNSDKRALMRLEEEASNDFGLSFWVTDNQVPAEKIRFTGNGDVGIGTTAPETDLAVHGTEPQFRVYDTSSTGFATEYMEMSYDAADNVGHIGANTLGGTAYFQIKGVGSTPTLPQFVFNTTDTVNALAILSNGNVGIGITAPNSSLDVAGTVQIGATYAGLGTSNATNGLVIEGNIGIGTTSPASLIDIFSPNPTIRITKDAATDRITTISVDDGNILLDPSGSGRYVVVGRTTGSGILLEDEKEITFGDDQDYSMGYNSESDTLQFVDGNAINTNVRMVLDSNGYIGIGTTAPSTELEVAGTVTATAFSTGVGSIDNYSLDADDGDPADAVYVDANGQVGIGTTVPNVPLEVNASNPTSSDLRDASLISAGGGATGQLYLEGSTQANIILDDSGGIPNEQMVQLINAGGDTSFQIFNDSGTVKNDSVLVIDNTNGNIGIGVGPTALLEINKALAAPSDLGDYDNYQLVIGGDTDTGDTAGILLQTSADTYGGSAIVHYDTGGGGMGDLAFYTKQSTAAEPPVEVMRLDDSGLVGIGTVTPNSTLDVAGAVQIGSTYAGLGTSNATDGLVVEGNVGIGTTSPDYLLDIDGGSFRVANTGGDANVIAKIYSSANVIARLQATNDVGDAASFGIMSSGGTSWPARSSVISYSANGPLVIAEGTSEMMRIDNNGNVGIGTTDPQGLLDVNGTIYQRGGELHADYVFEPDYGLESIEKHAEYMWREKHLEAIPPKEYDSEGQEVLEIGAHRKGIVEELEKAHVYIQQLDERIKALEAKIGK